MSCEVKRQNRKVKSENSLFEGGENDKVVQGDDLRTLLSRIFDKTLPKIIQIIPRRHLQRGNTLQQLLASTFLLFVFTLIFSNCTDSFQPLQENDQYHFSMYGYLDASADTQWVRISPAREQLETTAEIPEMKVTVENLATGDTITLRDSLFQNRGGNYLNFWTTEPIQHNQSYRLVAEGPNGKRSQVTVNIPGELPTPLVIIQQFFGQPTTYQVVVDNSVNVADVQSKWYVRLVAPNLDERRVFSFAYRNSAKTTDAFGGAFTYLLEPEKELDEIERQVLLPQNGKIEVVYRQIYVASSSSDWSSNIASLDDLTYSLPETFSNVENGAGFLIGIDSKYVPYASCENENQTQVIPCRDEDAFW